MLVFTALADVDRLHCRLINYRVLAETTEADTPQYAQLEMAQAVRAPDCPWSDMTRLVLEVAPCR